MKKEGKEGDLALEYPKSGLHAIVPWKGKKQQFNHEKSPNWNFISDKIIEYIPYCETKYERKVIMEMNLPFKWN